MSTATRNLLRRLRELMATSGSFSPLTDLVRLVAEELHSDVCSIYAMRAGDLLELVATQGLKPDSVGRTRLRVGEGIVGVVAAQGRVLNLPDAQNHPAFVYRPETGEEPFSSMVAVPVRRGGRVMGVLAVQCRMPHSFSEEEVEVLQTVSMLLSEFLVAAGARDGAEEGLGSALSRHFSGTTLANGMVMGTVMIAGTAAPPRKLLAEDPEAELLRLSNAAEAMRRGLDELIDSGLPTANWTTAQDDNPREVLETTRLLAAGSGWLKRVAEAIQGGLTAEAAVHRVANEVRDRMRRFTDPYLRERLADVEDLAQRLISVLDGESPAPTVAPGTILLARRLGPAQLLAWHAHGIAGFAIEEASPAGHAAIMARALSIPTLGGVRGLLDSANNGDRTIMDADNGTLILRPEAEVTQTYTRALAARRVREAGYAALRDKPAVTADGIAVKLMLNIGLTMELEQLEVTGADGIGLFRTEIAMLARGGIADVNEQTEMYRLALDKADGKPVVFRTLDLGGDKLLPGAPMMSEDNPAMGWRSLRIGLDRPALLRRQLRAMLQAAGGHDLNIMFPMVATVQEFRDARRLFWTEAARVRPAPRQVKLGTMLEVPSLLWQMPALLAEADFVSVGSNDLMQFLFAADRGSARLAGRYDFLSGPVLEIMDQVAKHTNASGKGLSLCGEAASRPLEALTLVALGFRVLSMPAGALLPLKSLLSAVDIGEYRALLDTLRSRNSGETSLREPIMAWAREHSWPLE